MSVRRQGPAHMAFGVWSHTTACAGRSTQEIFAYICTTLGLKRAPPCNLSLVEAVVRDRHGSIVPAMTIYRTLHALTTMCRILPSEAQMFERLKGGPPINLLLRKDEYEPLKRRARAIYKELLAFAEDRMQVRACAP